MRLRYPSMRETLPVLYRYRYHTRQYRLRLRPRGVCHQLRKLWRLSLSRRRVSRCFPANAIASHFGQRYTVEKRHKRGEREGRGFSARRVSLPLASLASGFPIKFNIPFAITYLINIHLWNHVPPFGSPVLLWDKCCGHLFFFQHICRVTRGSLINDTIFRRKGCIILEKS